MRAGNDLLSRVTALVEADRVEEVEVEHVGRVLLGLVATDIWEASLHQFGRFEVVARLDVEFDL